MYSLFVCRVKSVWIEDVRVGKMFWHSAHSCIGHLKKETPTFTSVGYSAMLQQLHKFWVSCS